MTDDKYTTGSGIAGGTTTVTDLPGGGKMMTWVEKDHKEPPKMTDQLSRDDLLKQRLWAATNDLSALLKELAAMVDNPPHAAESQEEHMGYIESALRSVRYNAGKLRSYKP